MYQHGVLFEDMPLAMRDAIELHSAHHAIPLSAQQYRQSIPVLQNAVERFVNPRAERRRIVALPALVAAIGEDGDTDLGIGLLEEESEGGVRLILENPIEPGTMMKWEVPGTTIAGEGTVVFSRSMETPMRLSFIVGVQRHQAPAARFGAIRRWISPAREATPAT